MTLLGSLSLWLAFLVGLWGAITGFVGGAQQRPDLQQSARNATFALFAALAVAVICLEIAIFRHDFSVQYVASRTSRNLPTFYLWSALYSGQEGSLLFWATVLSLFGVLTQLLTSRRHRMYLPYVAAVTCLVATVFVSVMWWAYVELGWGGYWAWDPVESAALLPWLVMTAFLHSVMIQEKRGMLKKWNLALIIGAWVLSIFGTFLTRSGVISSVHSFTQSPVGYFFLVFLVVAAIASFTLYATRLPLLEAEATLESMVSREAGFLFNNLLLIWIAFSVLWGTLFPILSEAVRGTKITVGPPFFNQVNIPLGLALLAMTGVGPLIAWRRASLSNLRRQFAVPTTSGVFVLLILLFAGMRDFGALMSFSIGGWRW